jgi:hypothetical protein
LVYSLKRSVAALGTGGRRARNALQSSVDCYSVVVGEDQRGKAELEFRNSLQVAGSLVDLHLTLDLAVSGDNNLVTLD